MIDVDVEDPAWLAAAPDCQALAIEAGEATLALAKARNSQVPTGTIAILLADDAAVGDLNARFRGQDRPTNVLSFPAPANPAHHLGDVALAYGVCAGEADAQGKSLAHHLQHLVAHGILHLLGYDHMTDEEADTMEALERDIMAGLGISDPYLASEGDDDRL